MDIYKLYEKVFFFRFKSNTMTFEWKSFILDPVRWTKTYLESVDFIFTLVDTLKMFVKKLKTRFFRLVYRLLTVKAVCIIVLNVTCTVSRGVGSVKFALEEVGCYCTVMHLVQEPSIFIHQKHLSILFAQFGSI